jgi:gluconate 2-dehydrogenase gamma chain
MKSTRREVLVTIAALAAPSPTQGQPASLTAPELESLTALVDAIIPRTDTPGASDAGVPATIDRRLAANPQLADRFRSGIKALDADAQSRFGAAFFALTSPQKIELLKPRGEDPFFRTVKDMTIDAYYTSREGLTEELGWHGNTFLSEFKGCTHPEHQH